MNKEELQKLLEDEIAKGNAILFNEENMKKILKDKSIEELDSMISDLMEAYSVDDDLMRIKAIEIIQKIIKEKNMNEKIILNCSSCPFTKNCLHNLDYFCIMKIGVKCIYKCCLLCPLIKREKEREKE